MNPQFKPQQIEKALRENGVDWIRRPEYFESIASSNDYLLEMQGSLHGHVCICDYQTRGKGRLGKQWFSSAGANLMFSLGWVPSGPLSSEISLLVGVALADALREFGIEGVGLKWPNDILVAGHKLAGVLIESRTRGSQAELVIGIGLNVRHQSGDLKAVEQPWTDLAKLGFEEIDRQPMLTAILTGLAHRLEQLEMDGFEAIRRDWLTYHVYQGENMSYQYQGKTLVGRVLGLDKGGALLLETGGQQVAVSSGEVNSLRAQA